VSHKGWLVVLQLCALNGPVHAHRRQQARENCQDYKCNFYPIMKALLFFCWFHLALPFNLFSEFNCRDLFDLEWTIYQVHPIRKPRRSCRPVRWKRTFLYRIKLPFAFHLDTWISCKRYKIKRNIKFVKMTCFYQYLRVAKLETYSQPSILLRSCVRKEPLYCLRC
jgi:hypothetical protein